MESSTPEPADAPVFQRLDKLIQYISDSIPKGTKFGPIMKRVAVDMTEEIRVYPPEMIELYIKYFASMMYWVAEGNTPDEFPLPDNFNAIEE